MANSSSDDWEALSEGSLAGDEFEVVQVVTSTESGYRAQLEASRREVQAPHEELSGAVAAEGTSPLLVAAALLEEGQASPDTSAPAAEPAEAEARVESAHVEAAAPSSVPAARRKRRKNRQKQQQKAAQAASTAAQLESTQRLVALLMERLRDVEQQMGDLQANSVQQSTAIVRLQRDNRVLRRQHESLQETMLHLTEAPLRGRLNPKLRAVRELMAKETYKRCKRAPGGATRGSRLLIASRSTHHSALATPRESSARQGRGSQRRGARPAGGRSR